MGRVFFLGHPKEKRDPGCHRPASAARGRVPTGGRGLGARGVRSPPPVAMGTGGDGRRPRPAPPPPMEAAAAAPVGARARGGGGTGTTAAGRSGGSPSVTIPLGSPAGGGPGTGRDRPPLAAGGGRRPRRPGRGAAGPGLAAAATRRGPARRPGTAAGRGDERRKGREKAPELPVGF